MRIKLDNFEAADKVLERENKEMEHLYINLSGRAYGIKSAIDIVKRGGTTK